MLSEHFLLSLESSRQPCGGHWKGSLISWGVALAGFMVLMLFVVNPRSLLENQPTHLESDSALKKASTNLTTGKLSTKQQGAACVDGWRAPAECAPTFEYKGVTYHGCTTNRNNGVGWCSPDRMYSGTFIECTPCDEVCVDGWMAPPECEPHFEAYGLEFTGCTTYRNNGVGWCSPDPVYTAGSGTFIKCTPCQVKCQNGWQPLRDCVSSFVYQGVTYEGCTTINHNGQGWCSFAEAYNGKWADCTACKDSCPTGFAPPPGCAPTFQYKGVSYSGCTDVDYGLGFWCSPDTVYSGVSYDCLPCTLTVCLNGWQPARGCASKWTYQGQTYRGCSTVNNGDQGWCSLDAEYAGRSTACEACEQEAPETGRRKAASYLPGFKLLHGPCIQAEAPKFVLPTTVKAANDLLTSLPIRDAEAMFSSIKSQDIEELFQDFLDTIGSTAHGGRLGKRSFDTLQEYRYRLRVFSENLLQVLKMNAKAQAHARRPDHARFAITKHMDWTTDEFRSLLQSPASAPNNRTRQSGMVKGKADASLPCSGVVKGAARQQGSCGDCWAFDTVTVLRYTYFWMNDWHDPGSLSAEYLVDCDSTNSGCDGGWPHKAMEFIHEKGGLPSVSQYGPNTADRTGKPQDCKEDTTGGVKKAVQLTGPTDYYRSESEMASDFCERGALSVCIDAHSVHHYYSGVLDHAGCDSGRGSSYANHAVMVAGLDANARVWIVRNSWGLDWGVSPTSPYPPGGGHVLMAYGEDTCNIAYWSVGADGVGPP